MQVDLIVRGLCCLAPGVPGLTENIRIRSIIGRFLEHSRIFHFAAGSDDPLDGEFLIGSADWMHRNLSDRVEAAAPITSGACARGSGRSSRSASPTGAARGRCSRTAATRSCNPSPARRRAPRERTRR